jgi:S-formylglutathione hydrolase FrmB
VLRAYEDAADFYGNRAYFEAHYPVTLVRRDPSLARGLTIELDVGDADVWLSTVTAFHDELNNLGVVHEWKILSGDHSPSYWIDHLSEYVSFYGHAFGLSPTR